MGGLWLGFFTCLFCVLSAEQFLSEVLHTPCLYLFSAPAFFVLVLRRARRFPNSTTVSDFQVWVTVFLRWLLQSNVATWSLCSPGHLAIRPLGLVATWPSGLLGHLVNWP